jgi:hypothetical protein
MLKYLLLKLQQFVMKKVSKLNMKNLLRQLIVQKNISVNNLKNNLVFLLMNSMIIIKLNTFNAYL